jgi:hypothetical protein
VKRFSRVETGSFEREVRLRAREMNEMMLSVLRTCCAMYCETKSGPKWRGVSVRFPAVDRLEASDEIDSGCWWRDACG